MVTCLLIDETDISRFLGYQHRVSWLQTFSRVPTIGEYIIKNGKGLKVESVLWHDDEVQLTVAWDGWMS